MLILTPRNINKLKAFCAALVSWSQELIFFCWVTYSDLCSLHLLHERPQSALIHLYSINLFVTLQGTAKQVRKMQPLFHQHTGWLLSQSVVGLWSWKTRTQVRLTAHVNAWYMCMCSRSMAALNTEAQYYINNTVFMWVSVSVCFLFFQTPCLCSFYLKTTKNIKA